MGGCVRGVLRYAQEMKSEGIAPNTVAYNTAIRACGAAGELTEALQLVDEMEEENMNLTVVTFGSAVFACQLKGEWQLVSGIENMEAADASRGASGMDLLALVKNIDDRTVLCGGYGSSRKNRESEPLSVLFCFRLAVPGAVATAAVVGVIVMV